MLLPGMLQDFEDKDYNVKRAGYWELGRLGPDVDTEELQAKREKQERVKALAAQVGGSAVAAAHGEEPLFIQSTVTQFSSVYCSW